MFPLKCAGAWPLSHKVNFFRAAGIFQVHCKYSYYAYYKKCRAVVRSCDIFCSEQHQVRGAVEEMRRKVGH
jgi:hypothetical protein